MTEEAVHLRKENQEVRERLTQVEEFLRVALARIDELEQLKTPPPAFVKAKVKKPASEENKPRKKRGAEHNHGRSRAVPTQIVEHRIVTCPECQLRLGGIGLARVREVIDIPPPPPVEVIHHRMFKGWCAGCQKWHEAPVDLHAEVLGQGRIGVRLTSLIATLRTVMRVPVRQIRVAQQHVFEQQLWALCPPFVDQDVPQQTLCKRVERFLPERFVCVAIAGVPAHNTLAERSVRPLVIARKISGGSRSPKGSDTRMGLASLFGTWMAQGLNPFSQCLALLTQPNPLG